VTGMGQMAEELTEQVTSGLQRLWWLSLLRGVVMLVLGAFILVDPHLSVALAFWVFGLFAAVDGLLTAIIGLANLKEPGGIWFVIEGLAGLVLGVVVLAWPHTTISVLFYLLAVWALVVGLVALFAAIRLYREQDPGWHWTLAFGLATFAFGLVLVVHPAAKDFSVAVFGVLLGILAFVGGVIQLVGGLATRSLMSQLHRPSATV